MNDGAGALVLSSDEWAKSNGRTALATIVAQAAVADEFPYLARTPANATTKALEQAGLSVDDIDLFEINEAFASVALNSMRMLGVDESKVNVNGGAIALGHPIGASGARILMTLVHELRRRGGGLGCAAICSGGGQGDAVIVEVNGELEAGGLGRLVAGAVPGEPCHAAVADLDDVRHRHVHRRAACPAASVVAHQHEHPVRALGDLAHLDRVVLEQAVDAVPDLDDRVAALARAGLHRIWRIHVDRVLVPEPRRLSMSPSAKAA